MIVTNSVRTQDKYYRDTREHSIQSKGYAWYHDLASDLGRSVYSAADFLRWQHLHE